MKKWTKRLILPGILILTAALFAAAVAFDFERTTRFADLPPQALENVAISIKPYYGNEASITLNDTQKLRLLDALDELETRGLRLSAFAVAPEDKGYSITIHGTGQGSRVLTAAPGLQRIYTLEGGWFRHNLGDTQELNHYVYKLIEEAHNG